MAELLNPARPAHPSSNNPAPLPSSPQRNQVVSLAHGRHCAHRYLLDSEVHTFAFSVAANAILSFIPFIVLLYTLALSVFHSQAMVSVVNDMVNYFLPSNQALSTKNLAAAVTAHGVQVFSLVMILVACTGIFLPLEVALNQAWGVDQEPQLPSQPAVAFGLAILMVAARHGQHGSQRGCRRRCSPSSSSTTLTTSPSTASAPSSRRHHRRRPSCSSSAIYWLLPNRQVRPGVRFCARPLHRHRLARARIHALWPLLPHLDLAGLYGPFYVSVGLLFWAYVSGLILFAGAQFSVSRWGDKKESRRCPTMMKSN